MISRIYERLTGRPWTTVRSMSAEFGPPPGATYAVALRHYTDQELILHGDQILTELREREVAAPTVNPAWEGTCTCEDLEAHDPDCRQGHSPACNADCWSPTGCPARHSGTVHVEAVAP